jgi:3-deoxy-D-manno-octulosonate 8-phosphate phosphatase (KDO 8-P phosphatase)
MIKIVFLDVDGTLTDGGIFITETGDEIKKFNVKDGLAIASANYLGIKFAIITGRESKIVLKRASELSITDVYQKVKNKLDVMDRILKKYDISYDETAFIGDDLNDYKAMKKTALPMCPSNACEEIKNISKFVAKNKGGDGAVRECVEYVLKLNGLYEKYLELFI